MLRSAALYVADFVQEQSDLSYLEPLLSRRLSSADVFWSSKCKNRSHWENGDEMSNEKPPSLAKRRFDPIMTGKRLRFEDHLLKNEIPTFT